MKKRGRKIRKEKSENKIRKKNENKIKTHKRKDKEEKWKKNCE